MDERGPEPGGPAVGDDGEEASREIMAMDAFLACPVRQFRGYRKYVEQQSPFATLQGIKGTEFHRVLVVLVNDEGRTSSSRMTSILVSENSQGAT